MRLARAPLAGEVQADVLVVGAGLTGCLVAVDLVRRHRRVVVVDASTSGSRVVRIPGHIPCGPPLPYVSAQHKDLWAWCRDGHDVLGDTVRALALECGHLRHGGFLLARTREDASALAASEDALRDDALVAEFLDHYMLESRFDVTGFAGALWQGDEGVVDAQRLVAALAAEAEQRGAAIHEGTPVAELHVTPAGVVADTPRGSVRADQVLLACGAAAARLAPVLDGRLRAERWRTATLSRSTGAVLPSPGRLLGTELTWVATDTTLTVLEQRDSAVDALAEHFPVALQSVAATEGAVDVTADGLPLLGPLEDLPIAVAAGYGLLGLALAPLAARWLVETLLGGRSHVPPALAARRTLPTFAARGEAQ